MEPLHAIVLRVDVTPAITFSSESAWTKCYVVFDSYS